MLASEVLKIAQQEIGYIGKNTNAQLDDKTANGTGLYTKYARDCYNNGNNKLFSGSKQNFDYCCTFVYWCFLQALGDLSAVKAGNPVPYNIYCASSKWIKKAFNDKGRIFKEPEVGDVIVFVGSDGAPCHVGFVWKINGNTIETIEGNISKKVVTRKFDKNDKSLGYFCRPYYDAEPVVEPKPEQQEEVLENIENWETVYKNDEIWVQINYKSC